MVKYLANNNTLLIVNFTTKHNITDEEEKVIYNIVEVFTLFLQFPTIQ